MSDKTYRKPFGQATEFTMRFSEQREARVEKALSGKAFERQRVLLLL